jgi:tetratricopeptide (TPR) repeat protein
MELNGHERAEFFASFAGSDNDRWEQAIGQRLVHSVDGVGIISDANARYVWILFDDAQGPSQYISGIFEAGLVTDLELPAGDDEIQDALLQFTRTLPQRRNKAEEEKRRVRAEEQRAKEKEQRLREIEQRHEEEAAAREEFHSLKMLYGIDPFAYEYRDDPFDDDSPINPLFLVLKSIKEGDRISKQDEEWLEDQRLFSVLAEHYERTAYLDQNVAFVAKSSAYWRKANQPSRALRVTDYALDSQIWSVFSDQDKAPVLTSRGGALRDMGEFDKAEECARAVLHLTPDSFYPFNLLGGIYYSRGLPEEGDKYFAQAVRRGAGQDDAERTIRAVLKTSERETQQRVAHYLLQKDSSSGTNKYAWARRYL